jgi:hypothetical protein
MVNSISHIYKMYFEESASYFKYLHNLERSGDKSSKNPKASNIRCHFCDKNNKKLSDCIEIEKFKHQKKDGFELIFEEINALKWQM